MKITLKGDKPVTSDNFKTIIDMLNKEMGEKGWTVNNATMYIRFIDEDGHNPEKYGEIVERVYRFGEPEERKKTKTPAYKEPYGSELRTYDLRKNYFVSFYDEDIYPMVVSRRGGKASTVKFSMNELFRIAKELYKVNGLKKAPKGIYDTDNILMFISSLNDTRGTVVFALTKEEGNVIANDTVIDQCTVYIKT